MTRSGTATPRPGRSPGLRSTSVPAGRESARLRAWLSAYPGRAIEWDTTGRLTCSFGRLSIKPRLMPSTGCTLLHMGMGCSAVAENYDPPASCNHPSRPRRFVFPPRLERPFHQPATGQPLSASRRTPAPPIIPCVAQRTLTLCPGAGAPC